MMVVVVGGTRTDRGSGDALLDRHRGWGRGFILNGEEMESAMLSWTYSTLVGPSEVWATPP